MYRYIKRIITVLVCIIVLTVAGGLAVSYLFRDEVIRFALKSINDRVNSRIDVQSVHFSVFRRFPDASIEFRHVEIKSPKDFDTLDFDLPQGRRLLYAESVFAELNLLRLLKKDFRITSLEIRNGEINILTDKENRRNFIFWKTSEVVDTAASSPIELQNVTLRNTDVYYCHKRSNTIISLHAEKSRLSGKFSSREYSLETDWKGSIVHFSVDDDLFFLDKAVELSGKLDVTDSTFAIRRGDIVLAQMPMSVTGKFSTGNVVDLDLHLQGKNLDYQSLKSLLPENMNEPLRDYSGKGIFNIAADITGLSGKGNKPRTEIRFDMRNGQLTYRLNKIKLSDLSLQGSLVLGGKNPKSTNMLHLQSFKCRIGSGSIKGSLSVRGFKKPYVTLKMDGDVDLKLLHGFVPAKRMTGVDGRVKCDVTLITRLKRMVPKKTSDIEQQEIRGTMQFEEAAFTIDDLYRFNGIKGGLNFDKQVDISNLSLTLNDNDFKINGYAERLIPYMLNQSKTVYFNTDIVSENLSVDLLLPPTEDSENIKEKQKSTKSTRGLFPEDVIFDTDLTVGTFGFRNFRADRLFTRLSYKPGVLAVRSVKFSIGPGSVDAVGTVAGDNANNIRLLGESKLDGIDIRQLFRTFDNFSQNVVRAEHLNGKLSGDIGFAFGWDNKMRLRKESIEVESDLRLTGGELVGFEPLKNLSRFVALEELQNIKFSTLHTQIFIKNGQITLPETTVESSAFNLSGSGIHSFDNDYTYRVKVLLSEILAAKARKAKRENHENEYAEDGGKRTAIYLKIIGKADDFKISYDKAAAKASVASDIKREKQTVKSILKEEFGWFKKDSLPSTTPAPVNTGKLRFTFDDDPEKAATVDMPTDKKASRKKPKIEEEETIKMEWE